MATIPNTTNDAAGDTAASKISEDLAELGRRLGESVVEVRTRNHGAGAGTVWSAGGLIVTNQHVAPAERAEVVLSDGRSLAATVVARDPANDLAVLRVQAHGLAAVRVRDARTLRAGDLVFAVGHPYGVRQVLTAGIVTAALSGSPRNGERELLRAAVMLRPGNSGGPLADTAGRVAGINSMVAGGLALAVPSHLVERLTGAQPRPRRLGIEGRNASLPSAYAAAAGMHSISGVLVTGVASDSPAERAGLEPGDLLVAVKGRAVEDIEALQSALRAAPSDTVTLRLLHGGQPRDIEINLAPSEERLAA